MVVQIFLGELHKEWTELDVSASRTTTYGRLHDMSHPCQASPEPKNIIRSVCAGLRKKSDVCVMVVKKKQQGGKKTREC